MPNGPSDLFGTLIPPVNFIRNSYLLRGRRLGFGYKSAMRLVAYLFALSFASLAFGRSSIPDFTSVEPEINCRSTLALSPVSIEYSRLSHSDIYRPHECFKNVIRLFRELRNRLPELDQLDFNVLVIMDPAIEQLMRPRSYIAHLLKPNPPPSYFAVIPNRSDGNMMNFHVVLEYQGRIFDLNDTREISQYGQATSDYFKTFFIQGSAIKNLLKGTDVVGRTPEELYVYTFPGSFYLSLPIEKSWTISDLYRTFIGIKRQPLVELAQ